MNPINKLNLFSSASAMQGVQQAKGIGNQASAGGASANNPFADSIFSGQNTGLNSMKIGDVVNTPAQAGKPAGLSRLLYNA